MLVDQSRVKVSLAEADESKMFHRNDNSHFIKVCNDHVIEGKSKSIGTFQNKHIYFST
jgi:hypothetical protein